MSTYSEFVRNPWNFILRTLMIKVEEKAVEDMVKNGTSDVNYRSLLLYASNPHEMYNDELSYDVLSRVSNITVVMYIFDLDAYIIDNPYSITSSCMNNITVITKQCSNSYDVTTDRSMYGLCNLYGVFTRSFKYVYNASTSTIYIEGSSSSQYHFFQRIERWTGKASLRIYSTSRSSMPKTKFVNGEFPAVVPVPCNTEPMYSFLKLPKRVLEDHSYGLDLLEKIITVDKFTAAALYTKSTVHKTGISVSDLANIDKSRLLSRLGVFTTRDYDNKIKSYSCRLLSYGTLVILEDAVIGLFINSNSKTPFECSGQSRECIFVYMNHYCYYIGRTTHLAYTFNSNRVTLSESQNDVYTSEFEIMLADMSYSLYGNFVKSCKSPLTPSETRFGTCKQYLYKDIHENLNLIGK